jgi:hypothetical protein
MIDSIAKTIGIVLNALYAPTIFEGSFENLTVDEQATVMMVLSKHQARLNSVATLSAVNAMIVSPIPLLSVGMAAHFIGSYLIFMDMPRRILIT